MHEVVASALPKFTFHFLISQVRKASKPPKKQFWKRSGSGGEIMGIFDADEVMTIYSLKEAIKDGLLVEIFKSRWNDLSGGMPIVATANLFDNVKRAELTEIWNEFVDWNRYVKDKLPDEEKMVSTEVNYLNVWVIEDRVAYTLMYPEEIFEEPALISPCGAW